MDGGRLKMEPKDTRRTPLRSFRDLDVYQRAQRAMRDVHQLVLEFPEHERFGLTDQMRRASKSVGALIAEGWGLRQSEREFKNYLRRALGSANEMEAHLETTRDLSYAKIDAANALGSEYRLLGGQLVRLIANWRTYDRLPSIVDLPSSAGSRRRTGGAQ
jgi:four helix bundle protein